MYEGVHNHHHTKTYYGTANEIDGIAGVIKANHPDFQYQPLSPPEEGGDAGRIRWVSGSPGFDPLP